MIVTIVSDVLGKKNNGTSIAAYNLMDTLIKKGHTVKVLCPDAEKKGQVNWFVVPTIHFGVFDKIVEANGVTLAKGDPKTIKEAIQGSDIVHIMMPFSLGRTTVDIANEMGIPVSAGFHVQAENVTSHFFNFMGSNKVNKWVYKNFYEKFFSKVDAIHYPTQFIRDVFEDAVQKKTNGYVISNGVSKDFHRKKVVRPPELEGKFLILCVGRYAKEKQQGLLIDAWSMSRHKDEIKVIFGGSGPREKQMRRHAKKRGVSPIMKFYSRAELVDTINMCDLYVHTSEVEIEAISCLEAISCGLVPVINDSPKSATRYFAMDGKDLFALNDPKALAERIDYWIEHPEEKKERSEKYLGYAGQFDFDLCMDKMEKMLLEVSASKKKA